MRLASLHVHPVKSTAVRTVEAAPVLPRGLADDRSWVVVDDDGVLVSARELRTLLHVVADTPVTRPGLGAPLRLRHPGAPDLHVGLPSGPRTRVGLFGHELSGIPADDAAHRWLREVTGRADLRLVWCDDPTRRRLDPQHSTPGDHTAWADDFPVTLVSTSSLAQLAAWLGEEALERGEGAAAPVPAARFRPNLVVTGAEPFAEDHWSRVRVGEVSFRVAKPVDRCVVTTIDPVSLTRGHEPLRTLARHRRHGTKVRFAVNLVPETTGTVRVGDEVQVSAPRDAGDR